MPSPSRTFVVALLVAALSHAPLPYVHRHDGLTGDQLALHLQKCHSESQPGKLPDGWHAHFVQYDCIEDNSRADAIVCCDAATTLCELRFADLHEPTPHGDDDLGEAPAAQMAAATSGHRLDALPPPTDVTTLFCILRI